MFIRRARARGATHRNDASLPRAFARRSVPSRMCVASASRVAKGIVALLAVSLGAASGETLAPLPGDEPAIATCRAEAHRSVFELEAQALGTSGTPDTSSLCARVMSNPGLRCVIAAASTRCRLARAEVHARAACETTRADACEACVMRALAGASGESSEEPSERTLLLTRVARADATEPLSVSFTDRLKGDEGAKRVTILPPAMEWQVYLAEHDAVARECARAEDAWRAEAAARALARVLEKARDAERATDARDAAAREAAAAVLAEVHAARAAAADASDRLAALEARARDVASSMDAWRDDAEAFARAHAATLRGIETRAGTIHQVVGVTSAKVDAFFYFADAYGRTARALLEAARRDAGAARDAVEAAAAAAAAAAARETAGGTLVSVIKSVKSALWRLALLAVRFLALAWRFFTRTNVFLYRVVPARYRVPAGLAAAAAIRRARRRRAAETAETKTLVSFFSRDARESFALFRREHAEVLAELRALRREATERALFEPRRAPRPRAGGGDADEARNLIKKRAGQSATRTTTRASDPSGERRGRRRAG